MKPIKFKNNLRVADNVRKAINRLNTSTELMQNAHYECFDNCREQGYVLQVYGAKLNTKYIAFSEHRCSDSIVVYVYDNVRFPSNLPETEKDWENRHYFDYNKVDEAAEFILSVAIPHAIQRANRS